MSFRGISNKNGRPVGSVNKISTEVKKAVSNILEDNIQEFYSRMNNLSDADYCKTYLQLIRFVLPTMRSIDAPTTENNLPFSKVEIEILKKD